MRAAPACQVSLRRFGAWRAAVLGLAALGIASIAGWTFTRDRPLDTMLIVATVLSASTIAVLGASLIRRTRPTDLRWDGLAWHLVPVGDAAMSGELRVAIDLGPWMLLRFTPALPEAYPRTVWLPVQRRGLEADWHALRCAVYSPLPAPADAAPVEP
jgi:hypothetical protein